MKKDNITIIETLKRDVLGDLESIKKQYNNSNIILDSSDFSSIEFTSNGYTSQENNILNEIYDFCERECGSCHCCPQEQCVLYRIENIIIGLENK